MRKIILLMYIMLNLHIIMNKQTILILSMFIRQILIDEQQSCIQKLFCK